MDLIDPVLKGPADQAADPWGAGAAAAGPASDPWQSYGNYRRTHKLGLDDINKIANIMMIIMHFWLAIRLVILAFLVLSFKSTFYSSVKHQKSQF